MGRAINNAGSMRLDPRLYCSHKEQSKPRDHSGSRLPRVSLGGPWPTEQPFPSKGKAKEMSAVSSDPIKTVEAHFRLSQIQTNDADKECVSGPRLSIFFVS